MAHKITAPAGAHVHGPVRPTDNALDLWWVRGELYIDLTAQPEAGGLVNYFTRKGYTIATGQTVPEAYTAAVAGLREQAEQHFGIRPPVATQDGSVGPRLNYVDQNL